MEAGQRKGGAVYFHLVELETRAKSLKGLSM